MKPTIRIIHSRAQNAALAAMGPGFRQLTLAGVVLFVSVVATAQEASTSAAVAPMEEVKVKVDEGKSHLDAAPLRLAGRDEKPDRQLKFDLPKGIKAEIPLDLDGRAQGTTSYTLDAAGTQSSSAAAVSPRARLGLRLTGAKDWPVSVTGEYEQDLPTGTSTAALPAGMGMPGDQYYYAPLRKAYLRLTYQDLLIAGAGVMTSHWGLGLVANDGAHGWEPGNARFADPRGGDRVLRGFLGTGPHTPYGLVVLVAVDKVLEDDTLLSAKELQAPNYSSGEDSAGQVVGLVSLGRPGDTWAGAYAAFRDQTSVDGRWLHATVMDVSGTTRRELSGSTTLFVGAEAAYICGATSLTGTPTYPVQGIRQFGAAVRSTLDAGRFGAALDGLYASGDPNPDDKYQNGFRANTNFDFGFILFDQLVAAQTARGSFNAGNPQLVGTLPYGGERIPTRGAATDTIAVFPRLFLRPLRGIEVYGGALFAWAATQMVDVFNTTIDGGSQRNAVNGTPGNYLGTELDAGVRGRFLLWGTELALGVEGGLLMPGSAFQSETGTTPPPIRSVRAMVGLKL